MSLDAATAAPSGHFLVSRKKPSVIAQTHLISVSFKSAVEILPHFFFALDFLIVNMVK